MDDQTLQQRLPPGVFQRMTDAANAGKFLKHAIDERALNTMLQLDEPTAMAVIEEIENTDLGRIRNCGVFHGHLQQVPSRRSGRAAPVLRPNTERDDVDAPDRTRRGISGPM